MEGELRALLRNRGADLLPERIGLKAQEKKAAPTRGASACRSRRP
jgi:hypothetical protein